MWELVEECMGWRGKKGKMIYGYGGELKGMDDCGEKKLCKKGVMRGEGKGNGDG